MFDSGDNLGLGFLFAVIGSFSMASYTVPIKAPAVVACKVHPLIFQSYKSFWVFATCWIFIIFNLLSDKPAYLFNIWPMIGAAAWVPSGLCTIAAVQRIGVGMAAVFVTSCSTLVQFFVGLGVGTHMKVHGSAGHTYVLYPYYLAAMILGMIGLVLSPTLGKKEKVAAKTVDDEQPLRDDETPQESGTIPTKDLVTGCILGVMAGIFSGLQFGVIELGKKALNPGDDATQAQKDHFAYLFDGFGSYMTGFGIGTGIVTPIYLGLLALPEKLKGKPAPSFHFKTLKLYGTIAGLCWVCGNVFQSQANIVGGGAIMGPACQAIQLICGGAWGILFYREVKEPKRIAAWVFCAIWTVVFLILFKNEKA